MMNKSLLAIACLFVASITIFANQERPSTISTPTTAIETDDFMKGKLKHSSNIVEGLALEDFKKIEGAAEALLALSHEADWNTLKTDRYLKMSDEFRSSTRRLQRAASEKSLDGATLAYFEVTLNCVRCHKYVRTK